jgi:hypothetical protein
MNQHRKVALTALAGVLALSLVGCGNTRYVPVSGVVTLDGKPYRNAIIMFLPITTQDNPNPGRGSSGFTDENGRFTLKTYEGQAGAAIGKHRVRITTKYSEKLRGYELWDAAKNEAVKAVSDPIPPEWNYESKKEFDVPSGGTDQAKFDIVSKKP